MTSSTSSQELAQLRDIHLPDAVGWWPLAPGWYVLAITIIIVFLLLGFFLTRHYVRGRARRQALRLLSSFQQQYEKEANSQSGAARISELLKRVALIYFPREQVAGLQGDPWITFLDSTAKGVDFKSMRVELLEVPYQPTTKCDLHRLFNMARTWISQRRGRCLN